MLNLYFNIFDYVYNNIFFFYNIYIIIYKFNLHIKFYLQYWSNIVKYYITFNSIAIKILKPFLLVYYLIKRIFLWTNRRFLKKRKRFRIYYRYHNVRYWKFLLFFFYLNIFFLLWKRRNLYRKSQFIIILVFLHIAILILLHFFLGLFNSFDLAFLSCLLFLSLMILIFKR
jgi:hypothetical protein